MRPVPLWRVVRLNRLVVMCLRSWSWQSLNWNSKLLLEAREDGIVGFGCVCEGEWEERVVVVSGKRKVGR